MAYAFPPGMYAATGTVFRLRGDWQQGFHGTLFDAAYGDIAIGPYGDGQAIALAGCIFCRIGDGVSTEWSGTAADLRLLDPAGG